MSEPELPVLDERTLDELVMTTGDDPAFVRELVETYLGDTPGLMEAIGLAVEADDAATLVRPAHTLKSSSATVGALRLSAVARELEFAGRAGTLEPSARALLDTARHEWTAVSEAFAAWLSSEGAA
jgi:HPt (histidine-containing phosphotransfer) domain-containing protein